MILNELEEYLKPTYFIDSDSDIVIEIAHSLTKNLDSDIEKAKALFYWTRDEILYEPYESFSTRKKHYKASQTLTKKQGWCVQKAIALAGLGRAIKIPTRLHFADIRNHMASKKMIDLLKTNIFYFHGYTELFINEKWIKATPAFNLSLCEKLGLRPVEFDGKMDGILHETTFDGRKHVDYLKDRGTYADLPFREIFEKFGKVYEFV